MRVNLSDNKAYKIQKIRILYFNSDNGVVKNFQFCPIASESYTAKSKKVALVIGHSGIWNNAMIYLSENQKLASQRPKQPLIESATHRSGLLVFTLILRGKQFLLVCLFCFVLLFVLFVCSGRNMRWSVVSLECHM